MVIAYAIKLSLNSLAPTVEARTREVIEQNSVGTVPREKAVRMTAIVGVRPFGGKLYIGTHL